MGAFERGSIAFLLALGLAACGADAGDRDCTEEECLEVALPGIRPGTFTAGDAAAGKVNTSDDDGRRNRGATGRLAAGTTRIGGASERDAGLSGSLGEQIVLSPDASSSPGSGNCDDCDRRCTEEYDLCDEAWRYCACADLCYYGCLQRAGGCGFDPEQLGWYLDMAEWEIEESGVVCP